jgi:hypothetical protein
MTLSDADIDRWSRQILLPEVGGRGQQRLLAARVGLSRGRGGNAVVDAVEDLLARAGVRTVPGRPDHEVDLVIDVVGHAWDHDALPAPLIRGTCRGATASVLTLVGRPCGSCAPRDAEATHDAPARDRLAGAAAAACAALVAAETLQALLERPRAGRRQYIDLRRGIFVGESLETIGCNLCHESRW